MSHAPDCSYRNKGECDCFGTEDYCPQNPVDGMDGHVPDWSTVTLDQDGDEIYVDVNCKHCGRSGCVGNLPQLLENLNW